MRYKICFYFFLLVAASDLVRQVYGHPSEMESLSLDIEFYAATILAWGVVIMHKLNNLSITVVVKEDDKESDK